MILSDFQTQEGLFTIAPFDHRTSLAQSLKLNLEHEEDQHTFLKLKRLFMKTLSPHTSAVLTDPEFGIKTLKEKAPRCGLFLSLEESGYSGDHDEMTKMFPNWGIDGVSKYNAGAKLLVYYNPTSKTAAQKLDLVKLTAEEAHRKGVVFLVEPVLYEVEGKKLWDKEWDDDWVETHLSVCEQIAPCCDILKVQYPGNAQACARVTRMHPDWVVLSRAAQYEDFAAYLKVCAQAGCRGFAGGRAVWQELTTLPPDEWEKFLETTSVERIKNLTKILLENLPAH